jgi:hypothetical protein
MSGNCHGKWSREALHGIDPGRFSILKDLKDTPAKVCANIDASLVTRETGINNQSKRGHKRSPRKEPVTTAIVTEKV